MKRGEEFFLTQEPSVFHEKVLILLAFIRGVGQSYARKGKILTLRSAVGEAGCFFKNLSAKIFLAAVEYESL